MENFISIKNVDKVYDNVVALSNVSLEIEEGKIIGLLGPNGSGKTTLIKILTGLLKNYRGNVKIAGNEPSEITKSYVAYLPDRDFLSERFTVRGALNYYKEFFNDFDKEKAIGLLDKFGISLDKRIKTLSKGNKEKVQLILTLSRDAKLYIFDEPIAGVDPAARDVIFNLIKENLKPNTSMIISTHLIAEIETILDTVVFLKNGVVALCGDKQQIIEEKNTTIDALFREVFKW